MQLASGNQVFYHGTSKRNARHILKEGFRDWSWIESTPLIKHKAKQGITKWFHGGYYGHGTYITCNWRAALYFGPVLFRVELQANTRLLDLGTPPEPRVIDSLVREFGREILTKSPHKVMPRNKRLTLDEAIQLARYHAENMGYYNGRKADLQQNHEKQFLELRSILIRYGIQGWGETSDLGGIAIFATDRIKAREVIVSLPTETTWNKFRQTEITKGTDQDLHTVVQSMHRADNRGADATRRWLTEANLMLAKK